VFWGYGGCPPPLYFKMNDLHPPCGYNYVVLGGMKDVPPVDIVWGLGV